MLFIFYLALSLSQLVAAVPLNGDHNNSSSSSTTTSLSCNGHSALCGRRYSNVTFLGAHNSPFVGILPANNQFVAPLKQLGLGVRFLEAQTHSRAIGTHLFDGLNSIQLEELSSTLNIKSVPVRPVTAPVAAVDAPGAVSNTSFSGDPTVMRANYAASGPYTSSVNTATPASADNSSNPSSYVPIGVLRVAEGEGVSVSFEQAIRMARDAENQREKHGLDPFEETAEAVSAVGDVVDAVIELTEKVWDAWKAWKAWKALMLKSNSRQSIDASVASSSQNRAESAYPTIELCHTDCIILDAGPLEDYLNDIAGWVEKNPNEVVTLLLTNPDKIDVKAYGEIFAKVGLDKYAFVPEKQLSLEEWPTLGEMIKSGKRVVVFMDYHANTEAVPYILDQFEYYFETPFSQTDPNFSQCMVDRPSKDTSPAGRMYLVNHTLNTPVILKSLLVPDAINSKKTNSAGSIMDQVSLCTKSYSRNPNVILLDFINIGDAFAVQNALNGL